MRQMDARRAARRSLGGTAGASAIVGLPAAGHALLSHHAPSPLVILLAVAAALPLWFLARRCRSVVYGAALLGFGQFAVHQISSGTTRPTDSWTLPGVHGDAVDSLALATHAVAMVVLLLASGVADRVAAALAGRRPRRSPLPLVTVARCRLAVSGRPVRRTGRRFLLKLTPRRGPPVFAVVTA